MAVLRAPKRPTPPKPESAEPNEQDVSRVIGRGGSVQGDRAEAPALTDPLKNVQLRLYQSTLEEIDEIRQRAAGGRRAMSRHAWMLQAIEEKLGRER